MTQQPLPCHRQLLGVLGRWMKPLRPVTQLDKLTVEIQRSIEPIDAAHILRLILVAILSGKLRLPQSPDPRQRDSRIRWSGHGQLTSQVV